MASLSLVNLFLCVHLLTAGSGLLIIYAHMTPPSRQIWRQVAREALDRLLKADVFAFQMRSERWAIATTEPYCDAPIEMIWWCRDTYRDDWKHRSVVRVGNNGRAGIRVAEVGLPCRKCKKCGTVRAMRWKDRIVSEIAMAEDSRLVTLTCAPQSRQALVMECCKKYGTIDPTPKERATVFYRWVQLYLKRLRKALPDGEIRFVAIIEPHADDYPHCHLLVHGVDCRLPNRFIRSVRWGHGFRDIRRVDPGAADYLAKYLNKTAIVIHASKRYGVSRNAESVANEQSEVQRELLTQTEQAELFPKGA